MNKENVKAVRAMIKKTPAEHFRMSSYLTSIIDWQGMPCGSAGCIAGFAVMVGTNSTVNEDQDTIRERYHMPTDEFAADFLGISSVQATILFEPPGVNMRMVRKKHALEILDRLLEKGSISSTDWLEVMA